MREHDTPAGRVTEKRAKLFTLSDVRAMDQIVYQYETFEVEADPTPVYLLGDVAFRRVIVLSIYRPSYWGFEYIVLGVSGFDVEFERSSSPIL